MITTFCTSAKVPILADPLVEYVNSRPLVSRPAPPLSSPLADQDTPLLQRRSPASAPRPPAPAPVPSSSSNVTGRQSPRRPVAPVKKKIPPPKPAPPPGTGGRKPVSPRNPRLPSSSPRNSDRYVVGTRVFSAKDPTTQLGVAMNEEFLVVSEQGPGWLYVRKRASRQEGLIPLSHVKYK